MGVFDARRQVPLELSEASAEAKIDELPGVGPAWGGNKCGEIKRRLARPIRDRVKKRMTIVVKMRLRDDSGKSKTRGIGVERDL